MRVLHYIFAVLVLGAISVGCAPTPTPTPTAVPTSPPPTATRIPSTNTPAPATAIPTAIPPTPVQPTATATPKPITIKISPHPTLGQILVDGDGRTLYLFVPDNKAASVCYDECARQWPPFFSPAKASAQDGANAALINTSPRKDGALQATYNSWALYYRITDTKPGDATGQGLDNIWFVLNPAGDAIRPANKPQDTGAGYGQ